MASISERALPGQTGASRKSLALAKLIAQFSANRPIRTILVVGCGSGDDARALAGYFNTQVEAIDLENYFVGTENTPVRFTQMNACELEFPDGTFDLVYSFHALEHIPDYKAAISEMRRVLKPGATYCIGTPNRRRLVGYLGVPGYSTRQKVWSNVIDWKLRLQGRFRNELGAHAGFAANELLAICSVIGPGRCIHDEYYASLYAGHRYAIAAIGALRLGWVAWPSVYVLGRRSEEGNSFG